MDEVIIIYLSTLALMSSGVPSIPTYAKMINWEWLPLSQIGVLQRDQVLLLV